MKFFNKTSLGFILRFSLIIFVSLGLVIAVSLYVSNPNIPAIEKITSTGVK